MPANAEKLQLSLNNSGNWTPQDFGLKSQPLEMRQIAQTNPLHGQRFAK